MLARRPVVLRGFLNASDAYHGVQGWTLRSFAQRFRGLRVLVKRDAWDLRTLTEMKFEDYADSILRPKDGHGGTLSLAPSNEFFQDPALLAQVAPLIERVHELRGTRASDLLSRLHTAFDDPYYFFIAAGGHSTQLHCDATTTFYFMVEGSANFTCCRRSSRRTSTCKANRSTLRTSRGSRIRRVTMQRPRFGGAPEANLSSCARVTSSSGRRLLGTTATLSRPSLSAYRLSRISPLQSVLTGPSSYTSPYVRGCC
jgi:hypothetical protein